MSRARRPPKRATPPKAVEPERKSHAALLIPVVAIVLIAIAYHGVADAGFVYDDRTQILENTYIQSGRHFWKSMTVDVWAFRGDKGQAWSNYWRPVFVAWLHLNYRLFAFHPAGWHVLNVVAHGLATLLVFFVLWRMRVTSTVQAMVTWWFAVHPVHVQSVTWISGIPDVLMTMFLLGSLLLFLRGRETASLQASLWSWGGALVLFAGGLLSKESAIAFPVVIAGMEVFFYRSSFGTAVRRSIPFLIMALLYLLVRASVIGGLREFAPFAPTLGGMLLSIPEALAFYVRQSLLPIELGPIYTLRPVTPDTIGLANLFGPLLLLAAVALACWALRSNRAALVGLVWFLGLLAVALDIRIFLAEMMVQDRYLYLPLFGMLLLAAAGIDRLTRFGYAVGIVLAVVLTGMTISYNKVWATEVALWEQGVRVAPASPTALTHLGEAYRSERRLPEARTALEKSLAIDPNITVSNIAIGALDINEGRYADAEQHLRRVLEVYPDYAGALEQLGLAYMQQKKFDEAIVLFREGARRMPYNSARYGVNVAVLYRLSGRRAEARQELESLRDSFAQSTDPKVVIGWYYLGDLNREERRLDNARTAYLRYLRATDSIRDDPGVDRLRQEIHAYGLE